MSWDISGDRNLTLTTQLVHDLPIDGKVNTSALGAPANLSLVSVGSSSLKVKWDAVEGATDYEVYVNMTKAPEAYKALSSILYSE